MAERRRLDRRLSPRRLRLGHPRARRGFPSELPHALILCQGGLPCALAVEGGGNRSIVLRGQGSIVCLGSNLCTAVQLANILAVQCEGDSRPVVEADGTVLNLSNTTFSACASSEDGGAIRAYGDARVAISDCLFIGCRRLALVAQ